VIAERGLARKVLVTNLAFKGLFSGVDPKMVVKMAPVVELATTLIAFKRPLTCVGSDVFLQCAKASKHLLTLSTLVWFIFTVHWQVNFEISRSSKTPSTLIALKRLLP